MLLVVVWSFLTGPRRRHSWPVFEIPAAHSSSFAVAVRIGLAFTGALLAPVRPTGRAAISQVRNRLASRYVINVPLVPAVRVLTGEYDVDFDLPRPQVSAK
jgi:hypothetical protein